MIKSRNLLLICFLSIAIANNPLRVDHKRLNDNFIKLSKISSVEFGSLSRVAYTDADIDGRKYVMQLMRAAGMDVYIDEGGNIIGRLKGKDNDLPPIAIGSHIDSVPDGGSYDGNVGSLAAIEAAHTIWENGLRLKHPLIVVIFQNEEGGLFGSKVMTTGLTDQELELKSSSGFTIKEGIKRIGGNLKKLENDFPSINFIFTKAGKDRQSSSYNGLKSLEPFNLKNVLIHDAARPDFSPALLNRLIKELKNNKSVIPAIRPNDSIKFKNRNMMINLDRDFIYLTQTLLNFRKDKISSTTPIS